MTKSLLVHPPSPPARNPMARPLRPADWALLAALWITAFAVFIPTRAYDFIHFDDQAYVADNPYVRAGLSWAGVGYAFSHRVVNNWHPLTLLVSEGLSSLFGPSAATFHTANTVLHATAVALLFAFLRAATGRRWPAVAAAALWGLHPLRVESVAWVAELKDELSSVTWLGCLLVYTCYARRRTPWRYAAVTGLCALALLSKPSAVTLPLVLLLTDAWPLGRDAGVQPSAGRYWARRVAEKVPLLAMAMAVAAVAVSGQGTPRMLVGVPLGGRLANAVVSVVAYLRQTVWPTGLAVFYPHPAQTQRWPSPAVLTADGLLLVGLTVAAGLAARRRPYLAVGWLWFLGVLTPNIGLLQAGEQARADRFTLLPAIGLTTAVVWLVADWAAPRAGRRAVAAVAAGVAAVALTGATRALLPTWRDARTVWVRADEVVPDNYLARALRSIDQIPDGQLASDERLAREAVAIAPGAPDGHTALALNLSAQHRVAEMAREFDAAIRLDPANPLVQFQAGVALAAAHEDPSARRRFERTLQLDPTFNDARLAMAVVLARDGDYPGAIAQLRAYLALSPGDAEAEGNLGDALRLNHRPAEAAPHYAAAIADGSRNPNWESALAWQVGRDGNSSADQLAQVLGPAKDACAQAGGRDPFPPYAYSLVLARLGRFDDAIAAAEQAQAAARRSGRADMAGAIADRLRAYRMGLPAAQPAAAAQRDPDPGAADRAH
jgi:tetratricopeptide (TPR) repeat protein